MSKKVSDTKQKFEPDVISEEPHGRYINPLTDFGFKRIFGTETNKDLLIDFLNAVLNIKSKIVSLTYGNVEHKGRIKTERGVCFDLYCITGKGERIIIEMQNIAQPNFKDRVLYDVTFPIQKQGEKGKIKTVKDKKGKSWNFKLKPVYSVNVLNFAFKENKDNKQYDDHYIHHVQLMDVKTNTVFYKKLIFVFIEMPDFNKPLNELRSKYDKWIYLLKYIADMKNIPDKMKKNRIFTKFCEQAELANMTEEERDLYDESLKIYRNMYTIENIIEDSKKAANKHYKRKYRRSLIKYQQKYEEAYQQEKVAYQQQNEAYQLQNEAKDKEIAELRRLLNLNKK
jgi:predicted transposase/invertase (TIGR01784 family)